MATRPCGLEHGTHNTPCPVLYAHAYFFQKVKQLPCSVSGDDEMSPNLLYQRVANLHCKLQSIAQALGSYHTGTADYATADSYVCRSSTGELRPLTQFMTTPDLHPARAISQPSIMTSSLPHISASAVQMIYLEPPPTTPILHSARSTSRYSAQTCIAPQHKTSCRPSK